MLKNQRDNFKTTKVNVKENLKSKIMSNIKNRKKEVLSSLRNNGDFLDSFDPYKKYVIDTIKGNLLLTFRIITVL